MLEFCTYYLNTYNSLLGEKTQLSQRIYRMSLCYYCQEN